jgi:hypothetical protein
MGAERERASQGSKFAAHVHFGSKADIRLSPVDVRYPPKSGHLRSQSVRSPDLRRREAGIIPSEGSPQACHTEEAVATFFGQTVTSSLFRHWTMIGMESVLSPV